MPPPRPVFKTFKALCGLLPAVLAAMLMGHRSAGHGAPPPSRVITAADGLPQSYISGLAQDAAGFVWIATKDGLARYDGRRMKCYRHRPGDTASLADNVITNLFKDREERLWIYYGQGDIDLLDTRTETVTHLTADPVYRPAKGQAPQGLFWAEDAQGRVWMRSLSTAVSMFRFDLRRHALRTYSTESLWRQPALGGSIAATGDTLWYATERGLYYFLSTDANPVTRLATALARPGDTIRGAYAWAIHRPGAFAELLIVDKDRIGVFTPATRAFRTLDSAEGRFIYQCPALTPVATGDVYVAIADTIYRFSREGSWAAWRQGRNEFRDAISLLGDRSGVLWVGGNATGIHQYDLRLSRMAGIPYHHGFHTDLFRDVLRFSLDQQQQTAFITDSYGLHWTRTRDGGYWLYQSGQFGASTTELVRLKDGRLSTPRWANNHLSESRRINALGESSTGALWGVDYYLKPYRFLPADSSIIGYPGIRPTGPFRYQSINSLIVDGEDTLWISTQGLGLLRYVVHSAHLIQYNQPGMAELTCMSRDPHDPDLLWIGSLGSGLIRFDKRTGQPRNLTTEDGLPDNTVYVALPDRLGRLWCSSNHGIFCYNPQDSSVRTFTRQDGVSDDEFNRFHFFALPDGRLCFGGLKGYTVFHPDAIATDGFDPPIVLTGLTVNGRDADFGLKGSPLRQSLNQLTELALPPHENFLTVEFAALEYNNPTKLQYRYMLQGLDEHWVDAGTRNTATYTALPPGAYELRIIAKNAGGVWSRQMRRLTITILPPFWRTWWFITLCCCAVAGVVWLAFRARLQAVQRKAAQQLAVARAMMEMERATSELEAGALRAQMNPHFIFNCLNSIKWLIQGKQDLRAVDYLTTFSRLIRTQLAGSKAEISLHEELETCRLYARMEALRFEQRIEVRFEADPSADLYSVTVPPLLLQPLLENAIWHGVLPKDEGGIITVSVSEKDGCLVCVINDNGIGRSQSADHKTSKVAGHESKGLELIRKRLEVHNHLRGLHDSMAVEDKLDSQGRPLGTRITLFFQKPTE